MEVEVTVKVGGQLVRTHVRQVQGTLEQLEETIHALGKQVARDTLQATVQAVESPRPLFRRRADGSDTGGINPAR